MRAESPEDASLLVRGVRRILGETLQSIVYLAEARHFYRTAIGRLLVAIEGFVVGPRSRKDPRACCIAVLLFG
jgi:hypothetical protein